MAWGKNLTKRREWKAGCGQAQLAEGEGLGRKAEVRPVRPCSHIMELIVSSYLQRLLNHYVLNEMSLGGRILLKWGGVGCGSGSSVRKNKRQRKGCDRKVVFRLQHK